MQITVQPGNKTREIPGVHTVMGLLNKLGIKPGLALVIREGQLLTPDRKLFPEDRIIVRKVTSRG